MPGPTRHYPTPAARQRAYRERQRAAAATEWTPAGLPAPSRLPTVPGTARAGRPCCSKPRSCSTPPRQRWRSTSPSGPTRGETGSEAPVSRSGWRRYKKSRAPWS